MGDCVTAQSQETDGEGEPFSFSKLFHDVEAYYISIGMTYDQFWYGDVWLAKVYRDAEELRERRAIALLTGKQCNLVFFVLVVLSTQIRRNAKYISRINHIIHLAVT